MKTTKQKKDSAKIQLANYVLAILEAHEQWNYDTIDNIAFEAYRLKLAHTNEETQLFQIIP